MSEQDDYILTGDINSPWTMRDGVRLEEILDTMDIPRAFRNDTDWMNRNLHVRNKDHPNFDEANDLLDKLLRIEKR